MSTPRPIVVAAPRPVARKSRSRKRSGGGGVGGLLSTSSGSLVAIGVAATVIGWAESGDDPIMAKLPEIPLIGRKGALAIAAYYFSKHGGGAIARDVAIAAAALAGYELGKEGEITGNG